MLVSFEGIRQLATLPAAALVAADITARDDVMA
jgi:predicted exporter